MVRSRFDSQLEQLNVELIKMGALCEEAITASVVEEYAKLPSKEVLLATVLSAFQAPIAAFARAVQAIVDKDGEAAAE